MDQQQNYEPYGGGNFSYNQSGFDTNNYLSINQASSGSQQHQHLNGKHETTAMPMLPPIQAYDPRNSQSTIPIPLDQNNFLSQSLPVVYHHHHQASPILPVTQPTATILPQNNKSVDCSSTHYPPIPSNYNLGMAPNHNQTDPVIQKPIDVTDFKNKNPLETITGNILQLQPAARETDILQQDIIPLTTTTTAQVTESSLNVEKIVPEKSSCIFNPEQNIFMMKALGVVRKEVLAPFSISSTKKRRRRIVQLNEDDDSDDNTSELKRELLNKSPDPCGTSILNSDKTQNEGEFTEDSSADSESDDPTTFLDPQAMKARSLLKSAVIIQGPINKKKKRVLESDDEDQITSVDDIGLEIEDDDENEDEPYASDILVSETAFEPINIDKTQIVVSIENSIIIQQQADFVVPASSTLLSDEKLKTEIKSTQLEINQEENLMMVKTEKCDIASSDSKQLIKTEDGDVDPSMSVEAILENIKPMADDDEFFNFDKSSDDDDVQIISNDEYFGTPDKITIPSARGRRRGPVPGSKRKISESRDRGRQKRGNKYEKDFVSGSSESEDTTYSESSSTTSETSEDEAPRGKIVHKKVAAPILVKTKNFTITNVPIKKKIDKDRFYDKSQDIPNDIYFGDVNVPLHVLHSKWEFDAESGSSSEPDNHTYTKTQSFNRGYNSSSSSSSKVKSSYPYIEHNEDPKLYTLKHLIKVAGIKINYGRLFDGIRSVDDKCMLIRRILAQKGLQGEPTIAKCKQLKLDLQTRKEIAELDTSVIIRTEGRTRRATRNTSKTSLIKPSTSSSFKVQPETLQTLSSLKRLIDTDSE